MAQVTAQHQALATKSALSQEQSTETVQVMLYTSASMLCRMREIFPPLAFDEVEFTDDDELYTYEGLLTAQEPRRAQPSSPSSVSTRSSEPTRLAVPLLKRGRSDRVNQFLDALALRRKILHTLRIPFMGDPETNTDPFELYTFRIKYKRSPEGEREVQGLETNLEDENIAFDPSVDIHGCVIRLLARLWEECKDLSQLPSERYMQPGIVYVDDGWEAEGYLESKSNVSVTGFAGWKPHIVDLGLNSGVHHDVALRVDTLMHEYSHTRRMSQDLKTRNPQVDKHNHPSDGTTLVTNASGGQLMIASPHEGRQKSFVSAVPETPPHITSSKDSLNSPRYPLDHTGTTINEAFDETETPTSNLLQAGGAPDMLSHSVITSASKVNDDHRLRNSLDNMIKSNSNLEDTFATQLRVRADQASNESISSTELDEHMAAYDFLSREKARQLWDEMPELQRRPSTLANGSITSCRCQLDDHMSEMIQCSICGVQQHLICQGFFESDGHTLSRHVCHLCLFGREVARDTLIKLRELALQRRMMDLLLSEEVDDTQELGMKLGDMQFDKLTELVTSLEQQGLIVEQSRRRTRTSQGKIAFPGSVSRTEYVDLLAKLFDPYQIVGHHFSALVVARKSMTDMKEALSSRYPLLARASTTRSSIASPELKRAATADASRKETNIIKKGINKKRARTSQLDEPLIAGPVTPIRRSQRKWTPTPKMKEAKFGLFINGQNLPSREDPAIKSKRFKGDS